jgi:hypothetical protein
MMIPAIAKLPGTTPAIGNVQVTGLAIGQHKIMDVIGSLQRIHPVDDTGAIFPLAGVP